VRVVSAEDIDRVLSFPALIAALADAFRGGITAPPRHHHTIPRPEGDATLIVMPAWTEAAPTAAFIGVKIVSVVPGNAAAGVPSVQGTYLLSDPRGTPLAALDGTRLTLWRTAAASALAGRDLARADASRMVMVGAGALAPYLVRAHASVRPLSDVAIWARRPVSAQAVADRLRGEGLPARATENLEGAVGEAHLVSCATLATEPLVQGAWLAPGTHLDLVGAFTPAMREADDEALTRASLYVDTDAALTEGGDVAVALKAGAIGRGAVRGRLADLVSGRVAGRTSSAEITAFKSVGASLEDLAAAMLVWRKLAGAGAPDAPS
jgi:ornithine cyclodeaminase/alanine dehydrogenase-like protein (mu-crystallin family)